MVQLGMTNSRMKDDYDLWFMSRHFEFEGSTLTAAVRATFERRGTVIPDRFPIGLTVEYAATLITCDSGRRSPRVSVLKLPLTSE